MDATMLARIELATVEIESLVMAELQKMCGAVTAKQRADTFSAMGAFAEIMEHLVDLRRALAALNCQLMLGHDQAGALLPPSTNAH